jgi:outer membrane receptor protein involved in Fe transport
VQPGRAGPTSGHSVNRLPGWAVLFWQGTRFSIDLVAGSGTRTTRPGGPPNGGSLPSYEQVNLGISHLPELPNVGAIRLRFDVINLFDEIYLLSSSTSLGAFSPAFGSRRTFYAGPTNEF